MNMCSFGCSNWGNRTISQHPIVSHVAGLFIKKLGNATVNAGIGRYLGKTRHTNSHMENV